MIQKKIFTVWLGGEMPELVKKCIESQKISGYEHKLITIDDVARIKGNQYLDAALKAKKWVKAVDWLRMYYLYNFGGIFLDADVEILNGKNFDALLSNKMFVGLEMADWANGRVVLGTAVLGAEASHPMIAKWMMEVQLNFKGDDDFYYESSMDLLNKIGVNYQDKMALMNPDVFFPYDHTTGKTNITPNTIAIHHFLKSWTPKSTLAHFKYSIENNINFSFVKRGDGEMACMNGEVGANCDGHPYSKKLAAELKKAFRYLEKNAIVVDFENQKDYNILLHRTDSNLSEVVSFYNAISDSKRPKYFIAPERLKEMALILKVDKHIIVQEKNAFSQFNNISKQLYTHKDAIYLLCAGMTSKPLIATLLSDAEEAGYGITCLDCGSAFDPLVSNTRTYQISKHDFIKLYRQDNFLLPQETHPEKLFALDNI